MRRDVRLITTEQSPIDELGRIRAALNAASKRIGTGASSECQSERQRWARVAALVEAWGLDTGDLTQIAG